MPVAPPRQRILDAALELASEGGFESLQVRALAERAAVSSRTIYVHFPSLESLLIIAVAERAGAELIQHFTRPVPKRRTAAARVQKITADLTDVMTENRVLTVALLRALLCGKPDVAEHVRNFSLILQAIMASAIAPDGASAADRVAAELLERIWFTALIGWATGVDEPDQIKVVMRRAAQRILLDR